jgi:hypothetical protein
MDTQSIDFRSSFGGTELGRCLTAAHEVHFCTPSVAQISRKGKGGGGS